ncbi:MAG TPA: thiamine pyrophosphate-binding protein [Chloroflexota bacterium]|nr:thiamine pyrophosphate-binding protein [Chloroflexota bacterium]
MSLNGAAVLVDALHTAGVHQVFTLSGNQILSIYDACLDRGIRLFDTRHEAAAAHLADASARLTGEPGVCLVSAGPGHTNALTGVANAALAESPVLWLSGGSDLKLTGTGAFQEMDQIGIARTVCKSAWRVEDLATLPRLLARAWRTMLEGRPGPVHLTLPADLLRASLSAPPTMPEAAAFQPTLRPADPTLVKRALRLLAEAKRPVVLAGPSVGRGANRDRLERFSGQTGVPWFPLESPRGIGDPALHHLGSTLREADVALLFGHLDFTVPWPGMPSLGGATRLIQVTPVSVSSGARRAVAFEIEGDAGPVLDQLLDQAGSHSWNVDAWRRLINTRRNENQGAFGDFERSDDVPLHPFRVVAEVRKLLPVGTTVSIDGGEFAQWARWALGENAFPTLLNGKLGMIGPAIPFAIAAALICPDHPSVAFLGDGTFGFHAMEFDTAVRHGIPFVAIVGNDAAWAAERHRQVALYGESRVVASELRPARYDEVVRALGGHGEFVERPEQLGPAVQRALASRKPACVNVIIRSVPSPAAGAI